MAILKSGRRDARYARLVESIEASRDALAKFRSRRNDTIALYCGHGYMDANPSGDTRSPAVARSPINLIELATNIYRRFLTSENVTCTVRARHADLQPIADDWTLAQQHVLEEMEFTETHQAWVLDAMFMIGCVKVGITQGNERELFGILHDVGLPFCDVVDLDDFCMDMGVKRIEQSRFIGDRSVVPVEMAYDLGLIPKNFDLPKEMLQGDVRRHYDEGGEPKIERYGPDGGDDEKLDAYMPMLELWDFWLPYEKMVCRFVGTCGSTAAPLIYPKPLSVRPWEGPECGPYHLLGFGRVPANTMPLAPVPMMTDLHELINGVFAKLGNQALRQKTVTVVGQGGSADAERLKYARDGEIIRADNPAATREAKYGGIEAPQLAFLMQTWDIASRVGGNLDSLGGLSPQAETLGQEEIVRQSSSMRIVDMKNRTMRATKKVIEAIGWYMWNDPLTVYPVEREIVPGVVIPSPIDPDMREENDFAELKFQLEPASFIVKSPQERLGALLTQFERIVLPLLPLFQQAGMAIDPLEILTTVARMSDTPELLRFVVAADPMMQAKLSNDGMEGSVEPAAPQGPRETYRRTIPGASRAGKDGVLAQVLMGKDAQPSEKAALGRPVG